MVAAALSPGARRPGARPSGPGSAGPRPALPKLHDLMADQRATPLQPGPTAVGTWSGGRFMRFGEPLDDERFIALITPDESIRTVMTADVYGAGDADRMLGRAIAGRAREEMCIVGAVGHDFYHASRCRTRPNPPRGQWRRRRALACARGGQCGRRSRVRTR